MDNVDSNINSFYEAVASFEKLLSCWICLHDYSGALKKYFGSLPTSHVNPYCSLIKQKRPALTRSCVAFDINEVQHFLSENPVPFLKKCHCGLLEAVIPVIRNGRIAGVMFVGPFRPEKEKISHFECLIQKKRTTGLLKLESRKHLLKEISFCEIKLIRNLALALSLMMGEILDNMEPLYSANLSRRGKIEMYIKREFRSTVSLEDLANFMCLSPSRISQLLKEYFNKGFAELLNEQRLGQSEKLLANSYFTIETIARECGFRDSSYFFRVFKTKFGISPGAYRKLKQKERFPEKLIC